MFLLPLPSFDLQHFQKFEGNVDWPGGAHAELITALPGCGWQLTVFSPNTPVVPDAGSPRRPSSRTDGFTVKRGKGGQQAGRKDTSQGCEPRLCKKIIQLFLALPVPLRNTHSPSQRPVIINTKGWGPAILSAQQAQGPNQLRG